MYLVMTGELLFQRSSLIKTVDSENGVLYVEDPDSFNDPEIKSLKSEGWKIQMRIPDA